MELEGSPRILGERKTTTLKKVDILGNGRPRSIHPSEDRLSGRLLFVGHGASCLGIAQAFGGDDYATQRRKRPFVGLDLGYILHFTSDSKGSKQ